MINKKLGNEYEKKLVELLSNKGFWCHLFAYKPEGQPCDVIAIRQDIPILIDVKHCCENRFAFSNIRDNQRNCFELAYKNGNTHCGFAIYFERWGEWRWLDYYKVEELEKNGEKSIAYDDTIELMYGTNY